MVSPTRRQTHSSERTIERHARPTRNRFAKKCRESGKIASSHAALALFGPHPALCQFVFRRRNARLPPPARPASLRWFDHHSWRPCVAGFRIQAHASHAQHRCQGGSPRRTDHQSRIARSRSDRDSQEAAERFRDGSRQGGGRRNHRNAEDRLSGSRDPRRGIGRVGRRIRIPVDHRSARRHDELHSRLSVLLRVDRARAQGRCHAGGSLRPEPQRPLHRDARPRCLPERSAHPRRPARPPGGRADRHGLSVPRKRRPRRLHAPLHRDDAGVHRAAPSGRGRARSRERRGGPPRRLLRARHQRARSCRAATCCS